jgi:hypothetical protein
MDAVVDNEAFLQRMNNPGTKEYDAIRKTLTPFGGDLFEVQHSANSPPRLHIFDDTGWWALEGAKRENLPGNNNYKWTGTWGQATWVVTYVDGKVTSQRVAPP